MDTVLRIKVDFGSAGTAALQRHIDPTTAGRERFHGNLDRSFGPDEGRSRPGISR